MIQIVGHIVTWLRLPVYEESSDRPQQMCVLSLKRHKRTEERKSSKIVPVLNYQPMKTYFVLN
jgi:hypothetical protein